MKILIPFWNLNNFERYIPQFRQLALGHDIVFLYRYGTPEFSWCDWAEFIELEFRNFGHKYADWWFNKDYAHSFVPVDLDLVYSLSGLWMGIYGHTIADYLDIPHVIRMRGDMVEARKYQKNVATRGLFQRLLFQNAMDDVFRKATLVIPIVDKFKLTLRGLGVNETQIFRSVPNGINVHQWTRNSGPVQFTPGYAGRISEEKGSKFLEELIRETPDYTWKITGPIQDESFKIPPNCHYLGVTNYKDMDKFYQQLSVLVCPSETEGFPNTLLEFYAQDKPVIASPQFMPEEVPIFGQVVSTSEIDNWINGLQNIEDHFDLYIGDHPRRHIEVYSWLNYSDLMTMAFNKALYLHSLN